MAMVKEMGGRTMGYLQSLRNMLQYLWLQRLHSIASTPSAISRPLLNGLPVTFSILQASRQNTKSELPSMYEAFLVGKTFVLPGTTGYIGKSPEEDVTKVEISVRKCPSYLQKGFMLLFPEVSVPKDGLTILTVCKHTDNDMSTWSSSVEEERDSLTKKFIEAGEEICTNLKSAGHWADFIDPSSGRAYFSPHTNDILLETDHRYTYLGLDIVDLGCCKCVSHPMWGTFTFVGTVFTNAPADSQPIRNILGV